MTVAVRSGTPCPGCGAQVATQTPFSDWLRALPQPLDSARISNQNLDYIWHVYRDDWLLTIEEKRHAADCDFAQRDTHGVVAQMLEAASGAMVKNERGEWRRVEYRGHYVIRFENTTPDDSEWIEVNGERVGKDVLLALLETGRLAPVTVIRRLRAAGNGVNN